MSQEEITGLFQTLFDWLNENQIGLEFFATNGNLIRLDFIYRERVQFKVSDNEFALWYINRYTQEGILIDSFTFYCISDWGNKNQGIDAHRELIKFIKNSFFFYRMNTVVLNHFKKEVLNNEY